MTSVLLAGSLLLALNGCPEPGSGETPGAIRTFAASGSFGSGATLSGTVTVDTGIGTVLALHIRVSGGNAASFERIERQASAGYAFIVQTTPPDRVWPKFIMGERTSPASLKDYAGGPLGPRTDVLFGDGRADRLLWGRLTLLPPDDGCSKPIS